MKILQTGFVIFLFPCMAGPVTSAVFHSSLQPGSLERAGASLSLDMEEDVEDLLDESTSGLQNLAVGDSKEACPAISACELPDEPHPHFGVPGHRNFRVCSVARVRSHERSKLSKPTK